MTHASRCDTQVPDHVGIGHALHVVENDSARVGQSAGRQPEQTRARNCLNERLDRNHNQPAHQEIECGGKMRQTESNRELRDDADQRERPDDDEERPAPRSVQWTERERRVGTCDKKINCRVVEDAK